MSTTIATSALTAVAAGSLQSDDVLAILDVHDLSQAASGSLRKTTLVNLYRTETTPVTVSTPLPDIRQAWNAGGVTFTAVKLNITDTASAAGSLLLDLQVGGVSKWSVTKAGAVLQASSLTVTAGGITITAGVLTIPGNTGLKFAGVDGGAYQIGNRVYLGQYSAQAFALSVDFTTGNVIVPAGGVTITGNSTITGTLGGITTLTVTTVTATSLGGTLTTASQPNITGVGTLGALNITGALNVGGITCTANITLTGAGSNVRVTNGILSVAGASAPDTGLSIGASTAATASAGAAALPATPQGFLLWYIGAGVIKVPYYQS